MPQRFARTIAFVLAAASCSHALRRPERPNVLLVTLDTTRADHLGAYGAARAATPVFDGLAREGVVFERAWTVAPLTTPAHASLMTGLYPSAHGVRNNGRFRLADGAATLAEAFAAAGYATGAFVGGFPASRAFGFAQGFEAFDDDFGRDASGQIASERPADAVDARALPWIASAARSGKPFLAWVHFYDAHEPYAPPRPYAERFAGRPYDGEIAFVDHELGRVVAALREAGALDRTIVVVAGDHGEGLGDHGEATHGLLVYEPTIHVPLLVRAPWAVKAGERRRDLASLVDVFPTIAALAGLPPPACDGRDLLAPAPAAGDDPTALGPGRGLYAESFFGAEEFGWAPLVAVRRGGVKWIASPHPERFDLDADPQERENLAGREPARDAAMADVLARVAAAASAYAVGGAEGRVDDELLARLQSLGYVGGGGAAGAAASPAAGRDPKEAIGDYNDYLAGQEAIRRGDDAVPTFERLVARDPGNPEFRLRLGQAYRGRGDVAAAEATFRDLVKRHPDYYLGYRRLTALLDAAGRPAESLAVWLELKKRGGSFVGLDARVAESYLAVDDPGKALEAASRGLAVAPADAELETLSGRALERLGRGGDALDRYRAALRSRPSDLPALDGAVALLKRLGRPGEVRGLVEDCLKRSAGDAEVRQRLPPS